jgi:SAM-dependent methyltransferase
MNPWLGIPEADYFGHMSSPNVGQYGVLNRLLRDALTTATPGTLLVLGCSAGNGLEHVDSAITSRVVAVDINPEYLKRLAERFPQPGFELQLQCADLDDCQWAPATFDLVHAALVFEYVDWAALLQQVAVALRPAGMLSVVLQRPSPDQPAVTPSPFSSLQSLASIFRFVDPGALAVQARSNRLEAVSQRTEVLSSGKAFEVIRFRRDSA